jgi:uncharacterized protein DUF2786
MKNVLERVQHLIALTSSPNENEARNAAILVVRLIQQHALVISMPARASRPKMRRRQSGASARESPDPTERILSPLGGDCVACGRRYRAGDVVYWFASGGGMHPPCYEKWVAGR